jgi:hypothetical protein
MRNSTEKEVESIVNKEMVSSVAFENTTHSLNKINRLIDLFTIEYSELENKKKQTKNEFLSKLMDRKIKQQIEMLEELE